MNGSNWTDERVALLRKLWGEGLSASQIARQLGGVTRNAVTGKSIRLGLQRRKQANPIGARKRNGQRFAKAQRELQALAEQRRPPPAPYVPMVLAAGPRSLPFLERMSTDCPFPIEGEGASMIVCGEPVTHGAWCERCASIVFNGQTAASVAMPRRRIAA